MKTTVFDIINIIVAGGLLGILGQGIRMAIGLKKHSDANALKAAGDAEPVDTTRLWISIFIGAIAGALFLLVNGTTRLDDREFLFSVIAAGYSGTDFIEGLFNNYIGKMNTSKTATTIPAAAAPQQIVVQMNPAPEDDTAGKIAPADREDEPSNNL